tara:strand:+ start:11364 stop:12251 length:888 start_codon:yes stop_codon:yes gene_type:complete
MIKSMTGFASVVREDVDVSLSVSVKSFNHRYLDIQLRVPQLFSDLEQPLRTLVQQLAQRGRVELTLTGRLVNEAPVRVVVNDALVTALTDAVDEIQARTSLEAGLSAGELLRFPQVVTVHEEPVDEGVWARVCEVVMDTVRSALVDLDSMRAKEGEILKRDLDERASTLEKLVEQIVLETEAGDATLRERLTGRISDLGVSVETDPGLVAQEVVKWVARSDIHEEVSRLRGHLEHFHDLVANRAACGRKLDFLIQEMNREINTIGSKAEGQQLGALVVTAKAELEKFREQVQNVE